MKSYKPLNNDFFYNGLLTYWPVSAQTMMSTCSRLPSRWIQRRTAARMWPSTPKARWLTCFTGWKSRTTWPMSWLTPPVWSPTGSVHAPTPTRPAQAWSPPLASCYSCWGYSFSWDDPQHQQQSQIRSNRHFMHGIITQLCNCSVIPIYVQTCMCRVAGTR